MIPRALSLVGTGIGLGILHVLTGPDHLSALATLSASVGSIPDAFILGVRWGIGHSTGLVLVGVVLIAISDDVGGGDDHQDDDDARVKVPDKLTVFFESLVGVFMILLGAYGMRRAWEKRFKAYGAIPSNGSESLVEDVNSQPSDDAETAELEDAEAAEQVMDGGDTRRFDETCGHFHFDVQGEEEDESLDNTAGGPRCFARCWKWFSIRLHTRTVALCAGVIHGLAGPGGVLGVIPAVQLHNSRLATIYLGTFCISSTLTMGVFAILYGTCSSRLVSGGQQQQQQQRSARTSIAVREFWIESLSASLSFLVGVLWLVLLSIGKLEDVFP